MTIPHLIQIDHSIPSDLVDFLDENGLRIVEQDECSRALTKVDLNKVTFETMLSPGEMSVKGEERLMRLVASGKIRLGVTVFWTLWKNPALIPEGWKSKEYIFFHGTILCDPENSRYALALLWGGGLLHYECVWLGRYLDSEDYSACLEG